MKYLQNKGFGKTGPVKKTKSEKYLTGTQVELLLQEVINSANEFNKNYIRDYAMIYLAYFLGMRIGEACIMERRHFADLEDRGVIYIPTLKQRERVRYNCASCGRKLKVRADRMGQEWPCPRCNVKNMVPIRPDVSTGIPEKEPPVIEEEVQKFCLDYLADRMRKDQTWLFESRPGRHVSTSYVSRVFSTYVAAAVKHQKDENAKTGLSIKHSFHSLRHGRGLRIWTITKDLTSVQEGLRQSSPAVAAIYSRLDPEEIKKQRKSFDAAAFRPALGSSKIKKIGGKKDASA